MITVEHVHKRRGSRHILDDVSFVARPGRVTGIVGPNGSGKSSTLRILLGLDRAGAGAALINGVPYTSLVRPLHTVGSMVEGPGAHRARSGRAHLLWMAVSNQIPRHRVDTVLDVVGLQRDGHRRVGSYSLGMKQRLGIAAALLGEPEVLILDEPINGLDPDGARWLRELLRRRAAEGATVLVSSHLMGELTRTADDVVVLHRGRVRAAASVEELRAGYGSVEEAYFWLIADRGTAA